MVVLYFQWSKVHLFNDTIRVQQYYDLIGGPLEYLGDLVGVVSWGIGCGSGYPGVYARTYTARSWINGIVRSN